MSATRLYRLTAIHLAVLYGVVGLTGESLHYLSTDPAAVWSASEAGQTVVYYHVHGPDFHGHFHRHVLHEHHSHTATRGHASHRAKDDVALTTPQSTHRPHACPALTLVAKLKLGYADGGAAALPFDELATPTCAGEVLASLVVALDFNARGPPYRLPA
jgi:hypothetical protein